MVNAHSPDTVLEDFLNGLVSETDTTKSSTLEFESENHARRSSKWDGFLQLFRTKFGKRRHLGRSLDPLNSFKISRRFSCSMREAACGSGMLQSPIMEGGLSYFKPQWKNFTLYDIQTATNNFHPENLIGKGGYAEVHKGRLRDGQLVAVKRLTRGTPEERSGDFLSELGIMAHLNHPNTTKLIGYGVEGGYYLVLELSPHGSLASMLHASKQKPRWYIRYKVAVGTAKGLQYLHEGCQRRIIHRDVKAANILLAEDFEPQICDFGLAKWLPERWTHLTVMKFDGTFGYLAPEFLMHGIVNEKTDVFAFGVLLLELVTGRRALDYSQQSLVMWAKPLLKKKRIKELADPSLGDDYNLLQMNLMVLAASLCVQHSSIKRPRISQASSSRKMIPRVDPVVTEAVTSEGELALQDAFGTWLPRLPVTEAGELAVQAASETLVTEITCHVLQILSGNYEGIDYMRKNKKPSPIRRSSMKNSLMQKAKT